MVSSVRSLAIMAAAVMALVQAYSPAPRDIAPIDMKSSCTAEAANDVNRGAAFLMALAPLDARRAFGRAAERDPDCALAGWGRAMSWLPADPWRMSQLALLEGRDAVRRAAGRGTPREQAYVKSAAALFDDDPSSEPFRSSLPPSQPSAASSPRAPAQTSAPGPHSPPVPIGTRLNRYRDATRNLAAEFVDDQVATIVFARATLLLSTVPGDDYASEAATLIERRFGVEFPSTTQSAGQSAGQSTTQTPTPSAAQTATQTPTQSAGQSDGVQLGAALTLLLARDGPTLADTAKGAADAVARMATLPLARYLPARTYTRIGDWRAAEASVEAAIKLAGTPASPELLYGIDRRDVAGEWLVEAYLQQGRFAKADSLIAEIRRALDAGVGADDPIAREAMFDALVRMRVRYVLARADWTSGLEANVRAQGCDAPSNSLASPSPSPLSASLPGSGSPAPTWSSFPTSFPSTAMSCAFLQAYSAARLAWPGAKADRLKEAARINERLGGTNGGPASILELLRVTVRAAIAAGQEEHAELELLLMHASDLEERLLRSGQLVLPFAPVAEIAGDLYHQANRFEQARRRYSDALIARPNRARSFLGIARASVRLDDAKAATDAYKQFLDAWADADPDLPEIAEARAWIAKANR
jgi:tetratricopeptide (TPR) repeat protein